MSFNIALCIFSSWLFVDEMQFLNATLNQTLRLDIKILMHMITLTVLSMNASMMLSMPQSYTLFGVVAIITYIIYKG